MFDINCIVLFNRHSYIEKNVEYKDTVDIHFFDLSIYTQEFVSVFLINMHHPL